MEHLYFQQLPVRESVKQNRRRFDDTTPTWDVLHTYPHDYKGDLRRRCSMSPLRDHGAGRARSEHYNEETGAVWMERVARTYPAASGSIRWRRGVGLHPVDPHDAPASWGAACIADPRGFGQGDAGIGAW